MIETLPQPLGEVKSAHPSAGGLSLTSTLSVGQTLGLPKGTRVLILEGTNYASNATVIRVMRNPYLYVLKTVDSLATISDYSPMASDNDAATDVVLSSLDTNANGDALWVGSHVPFRGVAADVDAVNGTASVLSGTYWNGSALSNISLTDNTASGGVTFAQDGTIVWSVPSDWAQATLAAIVGYTSGQTVPASREELFWVKLVVSAALDSSTTLNSLHALNRSTNYIDLTAGRIWEEQISSGPGGLGSIEALTDTGTASLLVTVATVGGRSRFV